LIFVLIMFYSCSKEDIIINKDISYNLDSLYKTSPISKQEVKKKKKSRKILKRKFNMKLSQVKINNYYTIISVEENDLKNRLYDLGCIPGTRIKKVLTTKDSDPAAYEISGDYILSLRKSEADLINVSKL